MSADDCGLIIDPAVLADIQRQCRERRAQLEASGQLPPLPPEWPLNAPSPSDSVVGVEKASLPTQPLSGAFWQGVLYGSPDALLSSRDAHSAFRLVAEQLQIPIEEGETLDTIRAGQLRKALRSRFGYGAAEGAMAALWRAAPLTEGCPLPNPEERDRAPGPLPVSPSQPQWMVELNAPGGTEREWLVQNGLWGG
jgi:hypothetical protein